MTKYVKMINSLNNLVRNGEFGVIKNKCISYEGSKYLIIKWDNGNTTYWFKERHKILSEFQSQVINEIKNLPNFKEMTWPDEVLEEGESLPLDSTHIPWIDKDNKCHLWKVDHQIYQKIMIQSGGECIEY